MTFEFRVTCGFGGDECFGLGEGGFVFLEGERGDPLHGEGVLDVGLVGLLLFHWDNLMRLR